MESVGIYFQLANIFVAVMFLISLGGCVVPVLPGPLLLGVTIVVYKLIFPEAMGWGGALFCLGVGVLSQVVDFITSWIGAKKFGATWRGGVGAVVGAILALFVPPQFITIFIFPFLGALVFEFLAGANFKTSAKAGVGAFLGGLVGMFFKFISCSVIFAVFLYSVIF